MIAEPAGLEFLIKRNVELERGLNDLGPELGSFAPGTMPDRIPAEDAFSFFGLMLGIFPPTALLFRIFGGTTGSAWWLSEWWLYVLILLVVAGSALTGYFSGKLVGKIVRELETQPVWLMMLFLPFIGLVWGIAAGAAGGMFMFIVGAVFGAVLGGAVGIAGVSLLVPLHRILKEGDLMERRRFVPLAAGISMLISAVILGFPA